MNAKPARRVLTGPVAALAAALTAGLWAAGCEAPEAAPPPPAATAATSYAAPPRVVEVEAAEDGLLVRGRAAPGERVRLLTVEGGAHGAAADSEGDFVVLAPGGEPGQPRLLGLSGQRGGRAVPAEGWLYVPPGAPEAAVVLRPGAPAAVLGAAQLLAAVDYDGGGAMTVSGRATPGTRVRVLVDGAPAGEGEAGPDGAFGVRLAAAVPPGERDVMVSTPEARVERRLLLAEGEAAGVMQTRAFDGGWRVTWRMPGGGHQTTFVFRPQAD